MTRGRRKDMTIPPSRALLQQRDYRARKAQYLADLEVRVKKAEEDNALLRQQVESLQAKLQAAAPAPSQSPYGPEVAQASSDLMHYLTLTSASITRFQQLAFYPGPSGAGPGHHVNRTPITLATPTYTPSPVAPPHTHKLSVSPRIELPPLAAPDRDRPAPERERERMPYREPLPPVHAYPHRALPSSVMGPAPTSSHSPPPRYPGPRDADRCGGYGDGRGPVEDDDEDEDDEMDDEMDMDRHSDGGRARDRFAQRMSDVRSTTSASSSGPEDGAGSRAVRTR
ncbi:hypothetical protein BD413DRAFT_470728 [Trametes elegans]|nr:hypothetical protein BD413DRAFT_470728 [Trametes elegans]